jgi:hypothetical protein
VSQISDARAELHQQLVLWTSDLLDEERVHLYAPTIIASPMLWIGQPGVTAQMQGNPGTKLRIVRFGVYCLADGYDPVQCAVLDELVARVWDAAYNMPKADAIVSVPQSIDIGGTSTRGVVTDVGVTVFSASLCSKTVAMPAHALA